MARQVNRLSARFVTTTKEPGRHADGGGLYLQVDASGAKRWVFVFKLKGVRKEMGLGGVAVLDLKDARLEAEKARKLAHAGVNPIEERKRRKAAPETVTFGDVADQLLADLEPSWKSDKHKYQWKQSLEVHAKPLRKIPVGAIDTEDVLSVLKPLWTTVPETASRTRGRIERVLDGAKAMGHRSGDNPARWRGHLALLLPPRKRLTRGHLAAMPFREAPSFMVQLRARIAVTARALEFTILTAARQSETLLAPWSEIDFEQKLWIIPGERMKGGVEHIVPLVPRAMEILERLHHEDTRPTDYIFPGMKAGRPISNMGMEMLLRRMGHDEITTHGFRSSFRDWAGETTNFPRDLAEMALAHKVGDEVERAYRRGTAIEKRRKMMEAWAGFLARPAGGKVLQMQGRG
jgi:integrase